MTSAAPCRWLRRECASAEVDGTLVLLDLDGLVYHSLNETATAAWRALAEPRTAAEIAAALQAEFAVEPAPCLAAVDRLLLEFEGHRLVESISS